MKMPRNWRNRIARLKKGADPVKARSDAYDFRTCAIGERRDLLELAGIDFGYEKIRPKDGYILQLGLEFAIVLNNGDYDGALAVLDRLDDYLRFMLAHKDRTSSSPNL